jgi:hypothetical protein
MDECSQAVRTLLFPRDGLEGNLVERLGSPLDAVIIDSPLSPLWFRITGPAGLDT